MPDPDEEVILTDEATGLPLTNDDGTKILIVEEGQEPLGYWVVLS